MIFLDTNIILRFILQDHPIYSPKAESIFNKIDNKEVKVCLSWLVIFEIVFVLQNSHNLKREDITQKLLPILSLENVIFEQKQLLNLTFEYYISKKISLADAYHIALMNKKKVTEIYSFDRDFDKFPKVKRLEN